LAALLLVVETAEVGTAVIVVLAGLDVVLVVVVAAVVPVVAAVPVVAVVAVAAVVPVALEVPAADPPGTRPSWLSAEKMLSMNPIMPPPACWLPWDEELWSLSLSLS
jgi:hypothetical protein